MAKRIVLSLAVLIVFWSSAFSQAGAGGLPDGIGLLSAIHDSMEIVPGLVDMSPYDKAELLRSVAVIDSAKRYFAAARQQAGYRTILRAESGDYWLSVKKLQSRDPELYHALQFVKRTANDDEMDSALSASGHPKLTAPVRVLQESQLIASIKQSQKKLNRYEKKYGPNSARLNPVESAFNFFVFRKCSLFGTGESGPGPLEFISSYSSSYVTAYDAETGKTFDDIGVVSAFEVGLRYYFLGENWGQEGFCNKLKKPGYATAGLLVTGEASGFFTWPLRGKESYGVFASWGGLKAGYIAGDNSRILLSRQFQIVPYLF